MRFVFSLALGATLGAKSILLDREATVLLSRAQAKDSEPSSPNFLRWNGTWPYKGHTPIKEKRGERLAQAAIIPPDADKCGGFMSFGDFTWCSRVMPPYTDDFEEKLRRKLVRGMRFFKNLEQQKYDETPTWSFGEQNGKRNAPGSSFHAISLGIQERDLWSEFMSNAFGTWSTLYDCFQNPEDPTPMGLPDRRPDVKGAGKCPPWYDSQVLKKKHGLRSALCYSAPYDPKPVCAGARDETRFPQHQLRGENKSWEFRSISTILRGFAPLSTFLKIDIEGSEWDVLEQLLENEDELGKIRSLDMEVHVNKFDRGDYDDFDLDKKVKLMEKLAERFVVVGSTISSFHQSLKRVMELKQKQEPDKIFQEPTAAYTENGFAMDQYCISFVNPALL